MNEVDDEQEQEIEKLKQQYPQMTKQQATKVFGMIQFNKKYFSTEHVLFVTVQSVQKIKLVDEDQTHFNTIIVNCQFGADQNAQLIALPLNVLKRDCFEGLSQQQQTNYLKVHVLPHFLSFLSLNSLQSLQSAQYSISFSWSPDGQLYLMVNS